MKLLDLFPIFTKMNDTEQKSFVSDYREKRSQAVVGQQKIKRILKKDLTEEQLFLMSEMGININDINTIRKG